MSLFHVLERLEVSRKPLPEQARNQLAQVGGVHLIIAVVWMRSPGDLPDEEFEQELVLIRPDKSERRILNSNGHFFPSDEKPLVRFLIRIQRFQASGPGVYRFESRLRKKGGSDFISQDYPITVIAAPEPPPDVSPPLSVN